MKIKQHKVLLPAVSVAVVVLGGGYFLANIPNKSSNVARAYTSSENAVDPATAPDSYVINIPDKVFKEYLNTRIANQTRTTRTSTQDITAGEARSITSISLGEDTRIANIEGVQYFTNLTFLQMNRTGITDISPVKDLTKLTSIHVSQSKVSDISPLKNLQNLRFAWVHGSNVTDFSVLGNGFPELSNVYALDNTSFRGFSPIPTYKSVKTNDIFKNPVIGTDGVVVPVTETAQVINVDENGNPDINGGYIKVQNLIGGGKMNLIFSKAMPTFGKNLNKTLNVQLPIEYNLDKTAPTFNAEATKHFNVGRGESIRARIEAATAQDEPGGSGLKSLTNDADEIGLDLDNPDSTGGYILTYTAIDNAGNVARAKRHIEVVDYPGLVAQIAKVTDEMKEGRTAESVAKLEEAVEAGKGFLYQPGTLYDDVEYWIEQIQQAIANLQTDKTPLTTALASHNAQPVYIQQTAEVATAKNQAEDINSQTNPTPAEVKAKTNALNEAIAKAKTAEQARQNSADRLLDYAEKAIQDNLAQKDELPVVDIDELKKAVAQIQDPAVKAEGEKRITEIEKAIEAKRQQINIAQKEQAERKLQAELAKQRALQAQTENTQRNPLSPNTGVQRQNQFENAIIAIAAGVFAALAGIAYKYKRNN